MTEYDNNFRGVLFRNERMREGKKDPEYQGSCEVDGAEYWLKAWINTSKKDGSKYMSLKFEQKEATAASTTKTATAAPVDFDDDSDIPF